MQNFLKTIQESKKARSATPINELSKNRWSPRSFKKKTIEDDKLMSLFEAARWSASAFNEQPWRFIVGKKDEETFDKIFDTLVEFNQNWTKNASALILNICKKTFTHNAKSNSTAAYDLGQAVSSVALEAVNQGLITHQMSGFDAQKAAKAFNLSDDFDCLSVTAVGYLDNPDALPEELFKVELQNRIRKPIDQLVFTDQLDKTPFTLN